MAMMDDYKSIRSVSALRDAITEAKTRSDRKQIYERAAYLGLLAKLPNAWCSDGTLTADDELDE